MIVTFPRHPHIYSYIYLIYLFHKRPFWTKDRSPRLSVCFEPQEVELYKIAFIGSAAETTCIDRNVYSSVLEKFRLTFHVIWNMC